MANFFQGYLALGCGAAGYGNPGTSFVEVSNVPCPYYVRQPITLALASATIVQGLGSGYCGPSHVPVYGSAVGGGSQVGSWPNPITQLGVYDQPTGGNLLFWFDMAKPFPIAPDGTVPVAAPYILDGPNSPHISITFSAGLPNGTWTPGAVVGVTVKGENVIAGRPVVISGSVVQST